MLRFSITVKAEQGDAQIGRGFIATDIKTNVSVPWNPEAIEQLCQDVATSGLAAIIEVINRTFFPEED